MTFDLEVWASYGYQIKWFIFPSSAASQVHAELVSDIGYKVQAVLVEEDEEEDECEATVAGAETQPGAATSGTVEAEAEEREPEGEKMEEQEEEEEEEAKEEHGEEEQQHEEEEETEGKDEEQLENEKEDGEEVQDAEAALVEEEERMREDEEKNIQTVGQVPAEPAESAVTGGGVVLVCCHTRCSRFNLFNQGTKTNVKGWFSDQKCPKMCWLTSAALAAVVEFHANNPLLFQTWKRRVKNSNTRPLSCQPTG